jgi:hypothetical protein
LVTLGGAALWPAARLLDPRSPDVIPKLFLQQPEHGERKNAIA